MIKSPSFSGGRFILLALVTLFVTLLVAILGLILLAAVLLEILILVIHNRSSEFVLAAWPLS